MRSFTTEVRPISLFRFRAFGAACTMTKMVELCNLVLRFSSILLHLSGSEFVVSSRQSAHPRELGREKSGKNVNC